MSSDQTSAIRCPNRSEPCSLRTPLTKMLNLLHDRDLNRIAKHRVSLRMGFFLHLAIYTAANLVFWLVNLATTRYRWHRWALLGWGVGVLFHGLAVFVFSEGAPIKRWMMTREMERLTSEA